MSDLFGNHIVGFPARWLICVLKQNYCIKLSLFTEFQCAYNVRVLMVIDLDDKELMTSALNTGAALGTASIRYC